MKFADFAPAVHLAFYAEIALGLFFVAFIAVAVNLMTTDEAKEIERRRQLPLGDDFLADVAAEDPAKETRQ